MKSILQSDYDRLEARKQELLKELRKAEIAIGKAAEHGDLSENAEFDAAKETRERVGERIKQLDSQMTGAYIIDDNDVPADEVTIGKVVEIEDLEDGDVVTYKLVGSDPDRDNDEISMESPLAQCMLNKKAGENFTLVLPNGLEREMRVKSLAVAKKD